MLITQNPFPQFFDADGKPLTDGRVYFGVAGQNPRTSPVAVYTDVAGTQPIAQPVRTLAGLMVRNGAPINVFTPGAYSIAVYASNGKLLAYAADSSAFDSVLSATTSFTRTLLDDADAPSARATLGAASLGANTFTGAQTLAGNASNPLEAVPKQQAESIATTARLGISPITVTVGSSAMTGTLPAETLDFRSTTLSSGTPVSRTAASSASITVPSAATLGTANGQAARIVWGWIDNAGTLEPFVCNSSGINLDETTLISTTAISGTSNLAGVVYSQTARTNVAFRVRGFCDVTQATAGTWVTTPSLVQGAGGLALANLNAYGYGQKLQDMISSRLASTTYYNMTGKPIEVNITVTGAASTGVAVTLTVDGTVAASGGYGNTQAGQLSATVAPGESYMLTLTNAVLTRWTERR